MVKPIETLLHLGGRQFFGDHWLLLIISLSNSTLLFVMAVPSKHLTVIRLGVQKKLHAQLNRLSDLEGKIWIMKKNQ